MSWTNQSKNSASYSNQGENSASYDNRSKEAVYLSRESGGFITQEGGGNILIERDPSTSWSNETKN